LTPCVKATATSVTILDNTTDTLNFLIIALNAFQAGPKWLDSRTTQFSWDIARSKCENIP